MPTGAGGAGAKKVAASYPPKKIAAGLAHTFCISNLDNERRIGGANGDKSEAVFAWGRNKYNVLGLSREDLDTEHVDHGEHGGGHKTRAPSSRELRDWNYPKQIWTGELYLSERTIRDSTVVLVEEPNNIWRADNSKILEPSLKGESRKFYQEMSTKDKPDGGVLAGGRALSMNDTIRGIRVDPKTKRNNEKDGTWVRCDIHEHRCPRGLVLKSFESQDVIVCSVCKKAQQPVEKAKQQPPSVTMFSSSLPTSDSKSCDYAICQGCYQNAEELRPFEVACGTNHSVMLMKKQSETSGQVFCAGLGNRGRLGVQHPYAHEGSTDLWYTPVDPKPPEEEPTFGPSDVWLPVSLETRVLRVVCGSDHTLCFAINGIVYAWGMNDRGQCGIGTTKDVLSPTPLFQSPGELQRPPGISGDDLQVNDLACGARHSLMIIGSSGRAEEGGYLYSWGCSDNRRLGLGKGLPVDQATPQLLEEGISDCKFTICAGGESHSGAAGMDGNGIRQLWMWGAGSYGRLGIGDECMELPTPRALDVLERWAIRQLALGAFHSLALCQDPKSGALRLKMWGAGDATGQNPVGENKITYIPQDLYLTNSMGQEVTGVEIKQIAAGTYTSIILLENGVVCTMGLGACGRLGNGEAKNQSKPPVIVKRREELKPHIAVMQVAKPSVISSFVGFSTKGEGGKAVSFEGEVRQESQQEQTHQETEDQGAKKENWELKELACGEMHTVALTNSGQVYVWGCSERGQLGLGEKNEANVWCPKLLRLPRGAKQVRQIAAGYEHCLALTAARQLYAWGKGDKGQLGVGSNEDTKTPKLCQIDGDVTFCAAGDEHSGAIVRRKEPGKPGEVWRCLYMWGATSMGRCGVGRKGMQVAMTPPCKITADEKAPSKGRDAFFNLEPVYLSCGQYHTAVLMTSRKVAPGVKVLEQRNGQVVSEGIAERPDPDIGGWKVRLPDNPQPKPIKHNALTCADGDEALPPWGRVWMFGGGHHGRLGNDDPTFRNLYNPTELRDLQEKLITVSCGAFHTIALQFDPKKAGTADQAGDVYVWGKGKMCCEQDDVLQPRPFQHIDLEQSNKICSVFAGPNHNIAVTLNGEVYCWGENNNGQLGVKRKQGHFKESGEWLVMPPELVEIQGNPEVSQRMPRQISASEGMKPAVLACDKEGLIMRTGAVLGTGATHTVVWLKNKDCVSWGNQSCGRLGLQDDNENKIVETPAKVKQEWSSVEAMSGMDPSDQAAGGGAAEDSAAKRAEEKEQNEAMMKAIANGQKVTRFDTMQALLKHEPREAQTHLRKEKEKQVGADLEDLFKHILELPVIEGGILQLQGNLDQSFCANLSVLKRGKEHDYADMNSGAISPCLSAYQELLFMLQQQAAYLSSLVESLHGENDEKDPEQQMVREVFDYLFNELDDERTLYLFIALLKLILMKEVRHAKALESVFHWKTSKFFTLFSDFAILRRFHYEQVVHKIMKCAPPPGKKGGKYPKTTLLGKIFEETEKMSPESIVFALNAADFKKGLTDCNLPVPDKAERTAKFNDMLNRFKDFVRTDLVKGISDGCKDLHPDITRLFHFTIRKIKERRFQADPSKRNPNVTEEEAQYEPMLRLFVKGIIVPVLMDPDTYGTKKVGLGRNEDLNNEVIQWNLRTIGQFLDKMVMDSFDPDTERFLQDEAKNKVKPELLKFCRNRLISEVEDDTDTKLLVSFFGSHYDRTPHTVSVPGATLMRLSNCLKQHIAKLKINEDDVLDIILKDIDLWTPEQIEQTETGDVTYNFVMNNRFLFKYQAVTICDTSRCPVPPSFSGNAKIGKGASKMQLMRRMKGDDAENGAEENPFDQLEDLFRKLPPLSATTFPELQKELGEARENATTENNRDFILAHSISKVLDFVTSDLVKLEAIPADVLDEMAQKVSERARHLKYLHQLEQTGIPEIQQKQREHKQALEAAEGMLKKAFQFSNNLKLPNDFARGVDNRNNLNFMRHTKAIERMGFGRTKEFTGQGMAFAPTKTYNMDKLEKSIGLKILDKVFQEETENSECNITLTLINGGLEITVSLRNNGAAEVVDNIVLVQKMTEAGLRDLRRSDSEKKVRLQGSRPFPLMECSSPQLLREVAKLAMNKR